MTAEGDVVTLPWGGAAGILVFSRSLWNTVCACIDGIAFCWDHCQSQCNKASRALKRSKC